MRVWAYLIILSLAGCSSSSPPAQGRVVVAWTMDWEGADVSPDALDALDQLRQELGPAPMTHFVSVAYFTKDAPEPTAAASLTRAIRPGDELAVHLHAWRSLAKASAITPRLSPSFLTGTDKLLTFEDGDTGFDVDLDAYSVPELRVLLRTSRRLLEQMHLHVSQSFRAGGYLGTPKVLQAVREEGFAIDSSATDARRLGADSQLLARRVQAIWPTVDATTQPWLVSVPGGELLEMPIAVLADTARADDIVNALDAARAHLQQNPGRDVFLVIGLELETAPDVAGRLREALDRIHGSHALPGSVVFTTLEDAAGRARSVIARAAR